MNTTCNPTENTRYEFKFDILEIASGSALPASYKFGRVRAGAHLSNWPSGDQYALPAGHAMTIAGISITPVDPTDADLMHMMKYYTFTLVVNDKVRWTGKLHHAPQTGGPSGISNVAAAELLTNGAPVGGLGFVFPEDFQVDVKENEVVYIEMRRGDGAPSPNMTGIVWLEVAALAAHTRPN
jgi:hypothetical protein